MSGFEIAGIVLAAVPLFISAAEKYRDGLDGIDKFFKKDRILKRYIQELETHQTLLRLHLQTIIGATNLPAAMQKELVENALSPLWENQNVEFQLRRSFGDTSESFRKIMTRMETVLGGQIQDDSRRPGKLYLAVSKSKKPAWLAEFFDRVEFSWKSPKRNDLLVELKNCNDDLFKLNSAFKEAHPYRKRQEIRKVHTAWHSRKEARRLFDRLTSSCTCSCQPDHRANLRIKPFTDYSEDDGYRTGCLLFDISFQGTLTDHRPFTVKIYREDDSKGPDSRVKIAIPGQVDKVDKAKWKVVPDLCSALEEAHNARNHMHLAIDDAKELWSIGTSTQSQSETPRFSLEALFPIFTQFATKRWLVREKLILAVISAYSALQLHDSPWLGTGLSSDKLFFSERGKQLDVTSVEAGSALGRPYVGCLMQFAPPQQQQQQQQQQHLPVTAQRPGARDAHLWLLGITLLELYLNRVVASSLGADLLASRLDAMNLLQEHYDDYSLSPCYYDAIRFCLFPKPDPSTRRIDFDDPAFRETFYRNVILPLEEELQENFEVDQHFWDGL